MKAGESGNCVSVTVLVCPDYSGTLIYRSAAECRVQEEADDLNWYECALDLKSSFNVGRGWIWGVKNMPLTTLSDWS